MASEFTKFAQEALDAYVEWMSEEHGVKVVLQELADQPEYTKMLSGNVDMVAESRGKGSKKEWLVAVKQIYQSPIAKPKPVLDIIKKRQNFYVEMDEETNSWVVRPNTPVYYACQNAMKVHASKRLDLVIHNAKNNDILVVQVPFEKQAYKDEFAKLYDFLGLAGKSCGKQDE